MIRNEKMKKSLLRSAGLLLTASLIFGTPGLTEVNATTVEGAHGEVILEELYPGWEFASTFEVTEGNYKYHAYLSTDQTEAWIYQIDILKTSKRLEIPEMLDGKKVTRLGFTLEDEDDCWKNIFGGYEDLYHGQDATDRNFDNITELVLPETLTAIQPATFATMDGIRKVKIPEGVTELKEQTFSNCDDLTTVSLPDSLADISYQTFYASPRLKNLNVSSNAKIRVKDRCVIRKRDGALVYVLPGKGKINIPNGTKKIMQYAFCSSTASSVYIPASVQVIEGDIFTKGPALGDEQKIKKVSVSKKNRVFKKDGSCIYNKKKKSLAILTVNSNTVRLSDKIEHLTLDVSVINNVTPGDGTGNNIRVIFPKNLRTITARGFHSANKIYYTGKKPPVTVIDPEYELEGYDDILPTAGAIYVPEKSKAAYKKWYKKNKCHQKKWVTYDPKTLR